SSSAVRWHEKNNRPMFCRIHGEDAGHTTNYCPDVLSLVEKPAQASANTAVVAPQKGKVAYVTILSTSSTYVGSEMGAFSLCLDNGAAGSIVRNKQILTDLRRASQPVQFSGLSGKTLQ